MECELENIKLYYEVYGKGYPVLMLHGFPIDHQVMKGCMEPIFESRENYKRIYFDLPGMGKTKGEKWIKNSDDMLDIVLEFIDKTILNQKFIIASESYGSYLARGIIQKKINFIDGVLFICPVIFPRPNIRSLPKHVVLIKDKKFISSLDSSDTKEFEDVAVIQKQKIWERYKNEINTADNDFINEIWEKGYPLSHDVDQLIEKFDKPTLFLMGKQDSVVGYQDALKLIERYPRSTIAVLDQAGHLLQIEQEKLFNSLVNDWLDRIEYYISQENKK